MSGNYPILYTFRRCPYAMRARMGIYQSGMKVYLREIVLRDKPEHMLEISPKGTVPVLQLHDGTVIDESLDIMEYALGRQDPDEWLDADGETTEYLIDFNDNKFKYALDRYKYPNRYPDEDCSNMRDHGEEFLKTLNDKLENHRYLLSDHISYADIAIFPFIRQFANVDRAWFDALPYKALQCWLEDHLESDLFKAIMTKFKPWKDSQETIIWPE